MRMKIIINWIMMKRCENKAKILIKRIKYKNNNKHLPKKMIFKDKIILEICNKLLRHNNNLISNNNL
jgi:hypothetical protein